jgi:WXXGXW repeat (2 copies)
MLRARVPLCLIAAWTASAFFITSARGQAPPPPPAPAGDNAQELTRGPIHEAFGQPTVFNPEPGPAVAKKPPELIEEVPPDQKPEGNNIAWIPGYWSYEDESKNYIWVSGFWRSIPPGRTWTPGYWNPITEGYQWISGYWGDERAAEVEYLPPPPESIEAGPSTEAVAQGQVWIPGCWVWRDTRYLWRPGFWTASNPDWVWSPAHYEYTPAGFVFVEGYWDYPLLGRGLLFAPVSFATVGVGFTYTPSLVIDPRFLLTSLFSRPSHFHYYFGDYYDQSYSRAGYYPWFAYHNSRLGYDPLYAQTAFINSRSDAQWAANMRQVYYDRREHQDARPPHTYRQFNDWARKTDPDGTHSIAYVRPLNEAARTRDFPVRLEHLDAKRIESVRAQSTQVQKFRTERIKIDQQAAGELTRTGKPGAVRTAPTRTKITAAPRLETGAPGVGGPGRTPAPGTGTRTALPEAPRIPELTPPNATPKLGPKTGTGARTLPHPDENFRPPTTGTPVPKTPGTGTTIPGTGTPAPGTGTPVPKGKGADQTPPVVPKQAPPAKNDPPREVPKKGPGPKKDKD